jgi:hypothetical protein
MCEDGLEAGPIDIAERQLRAGVRALAAHQHARARRPAADVQLFGELADVPVGALAGVLIDRRDPSFIGICPIATRTVSVRADRETK